MNRYVRLLPLAGILLFYAVICTAAMLTPGYSTFEQTISVLGARDARFPWLVNGLGIFPFAAGIVIAGIFLLYDLRPGVLARLAGVVTIIGGAGFVLVALAPCDPGCVPDGSVTMRLHLIAAGTGFQSIPIAAFLLGLRAFSSNCHRTFYASSLAMSVAMVIALAIFASTIDEPLALQGLWQRVLVLLISVWTGGIAVFLFRRAHQSVTVSSTGMRAKLQK